MGIFLVITGFVVLVPLVAELRAGDRLGRELVSAALIAAGLIWAGVGLWLLDDPMRGRAVESGVGLTLLGLLLRPSELHADAPTAEPGETAPGSEQVEAAAS